MKSRALEREKEEKGGETMERKAKEK